eukprot:m.37071 g.37071  ORF g.37071 m.37071 type:complete len:231 (-) comp12476_c1_seq54:164-856(-)
MMLNFMAATMIASMMLTLMASMMMAATIVLECPATPWPGTHQPDPRQSACLACPSGKYAARKGSSACTLQPGLVVTPTYYAKSIVLDVDNSAGRWAEFRVTLGIWRDNEYAYDLAAGYPKPLAATRSGSDFAATATITLPRLVPGQYYNIRVEARDKDAASGHFHTDDATINLAATTCGCRSDERTGTPTGFLISQYLGKVYFTWNDQSFCEDGFVLESESRKFSTCLRL